MKVFSILIFTMFLGALLVASFASGQTETYITVLTDTNRICYFRAVVTDGNSTVKLISCVNAEILGLDPQRTDILLTSLGDFEEPGFIETYYETTDGNQRETWHVRLDEILGRIGSDPEALGDLQTFLNNLDGYSMQYSDVPSAGLKKNNQQAEPLDRLFTAGTRNTTKANDYFSLAFNAGGLPTGSKGVIFSNPNTKTTLGGSINRDGSMAVQLSATSSSWTLTTRKLKNGVPAGAPFSWTVPAYNGYSPDITNAIEVNAGAAGSSATTGYYLVYRAFRNVGTTSQQSQILLQSLDASGHPIGSPTPITQFKNAFQASAETFQSLAISPNGKILLFAEYASCKKMILRWMRLANGAPSGAAKTAFGCSSVSQSPIGVVGMDIMRLPDSASN